MSNKPIIFLHLTKTAGGSLKTALAHTQGLKIAFAYGQMNIQSLIQDGIEDIDLIYGHLLFGIHEKLQIPARYMCFLRHPVLRTISHYYHLRNVDLSKVGDKIRESKDINDFFSNFEHWEFSNFQIKIISGIGNNKSHTNQDLLHLAKYNIQNYFVFVGFQEFFSLSARQLMKYLNINMSFKKKVNIGAFDDELISDTTIENIININKHDILFYQYNIERYLHGNKE